MEHHRTDTHQWVDVELCVIIDTVTGEHERWFPNNKAVGTLEEAIQSCSDMSTVNSNRFSERYVIVKLHCIKAFRHSGELS